VSIPPLFRPDLVRWQQLVTPTWLARLLSGELIEATPSDDWRLFEVGFGSLDLFLQGHIPGAGYIDTNQLEQEPLWNKVSDQALLQFLEGCRNTVRPADCVLLWQRLVRLTRFFLRLANELGTHQRVRRRMVRMESRPR